MRPDTNGSQPTVFERTTMRPIFASLATVAAVTLAGCNLDLTNPNNPTVTGALSNPRAATSRMVGGVMSSYRDQRLNLIRDFGSFGRENYYMFITDGRFITGFFRDWRQNNSFSGGIQWGGRYGNYRNAFAALTIVEATPTTTLPNQPGALTASEKAGALGVLKTFIALDMLHVIEARGPIGAVVDMTDDVNGVNPIVSEDSVYKWISAKLDEANADLTAAGAVPFYFSVTTGFSAFGVTANTPAGFAQFNRAIKARAEVEHATAGCGAPCYTTALTALTGSWIANLTAANRDSGVYSVYSTAAGDALNTVSFTGTSDLYTHPGIDSIKSTGGASVALDDRFRRKTTTTGVDPRTEVGVTSGRRPNLYPTNVTPIPIIRNEELILLRAEAEWFTGATAAATTDLASVRTNSGSTNGGTSAVAFAAPATNDEFVSELLLQRTLSLLEEGHRWVDYRRFGRLAVLGTLPQDVTAEFSVATTSFLPKQDRDARSRVGNPGGIPLSCPGNPVP